MDTFNVEFDANGKWYMKETHSMKVGEQYQAEVTIPANCKGEFDFAEGGQGAQIWRHNALTRQSDGKVIFDKRGKSPGADSVKLEPGVYIRTCDFDNGQGGLYGDAAADGTSVIAISLKKT